MASLVQRLQRIEAGLTPLEFDEGRPTPREIHERLTANVAALLGTMDPEHAARLTREVDELGRVGWQHATNLARHVRFQVRLHSGLEWPQDARAPLALPPEVARVWFNDPEATAEDACLTCHYHLPARHYYYFDPVTNTSHNMRPAISYFHVCPLCGSHDVRRIEDSEGLLQCNGMTYRAGRPIHASKGWLP